MHNYKNPNDKGANEMVMMRNCESDFDGLLVQADLGYEK